MLNYIGTDDLRIALELHGAYGYSPYSKQEADAMSRFDEHANAPKTARLELKTTDFAKDFIRRAAMLSGQDMTSFIIASAFEKAEAVMERHQRIELSEQGFSRLHDILAGDDGEPTQALRELMRGDVADRSA